MTTKTSLPDQPDGIEDHTTDLPELDRAAERVREYICASGDGMYHEVDGHPLYARDLEALRRAADYVWAAEQLRDALAKTLDQLTKTEAELDKVRAQLADTQKRAHTDATNLQQILRDKTALANERDALREQVESFSALLNQTQDQLGEAREQLFAQKPVMEAAQAWAEMREMDDVTPTEARKLAGALHAAIESYRVMDMALTSARDEAEVAR